MAKTEAVETGNKNDAKGNDEFISLETFKSLRKPIYGASILIGMIGMFVTLVLAIVVNGILDEGEKTVVLQLDATIGTIDSVESTVASVSDASGNINTTVSDAKAAMGSLKQGIALTGTSLTGFGTALKTVSLGIAGLSSYGDQASEAGSALTEAATKMGDVEKDLTEAAKSTGDIKIQINGIKDSISEQGTALSKAKNDVISIFESLKMANIIFSVLLLMMFSVLILNALGGFL